MQAKQIFRYGVDFLMTLDVIALMAFSVTGQAVHEWLGVFAFVLFCVHVYLNKGWFAALTRGKYPPYRVLQTALVFSLVCAMSAQMLSGAAMSRYAVAFLEIPLSSSAARVVHLACAYWCFVLVSLHLGIHLGIFIGLGRKLFRQGRPLSPVGRAFLRLVAFALATFGLYCFFALGIPDYMFLRSEFAFFDYDKPIFLALFEVVSLMALWTSIGYVLQKAAVRLGKKSIARS